MTILGGRMFDANKYLEKLHSMNPKDVAAMVKKALEDAGVEPCAGPTEILFDGLFDNKNPIKE